MAVEVEVEETPTGEVDVMVSFEEESGRDDDWAGEVVRSNVTAKGRNRPNPKSANAKDNEEVGKDNEGGGDKQED